MNRSTFNGMLGQYAVQELTGEGHVSWENGAHCVIPKVEIRGKAVQDGTPSPDNPIDPIFSEETTVAVRGKNLLDVTTVQLGKSLYGTINKTCPFSNSAACAVMCARSITEGTAYTLSINNEYTKIDRMFIADAQNVAVISYNWYAFASERGPLINFTAERHPEAVSTEPITHIWFCIKKKDGTEITYEDVIAAEPRIVRGTYTAETMPAYEPYFDGGTATCPETLLAIPDTEYYDTWNPQTGEGQHRFYKITLDGVTDRKKFRTVHNVVAADVFCVSMENIHGNQNITPTALAKSFAVVCNYFPFEKGYYENRIGAFNHDNRYYGLVAKFPYSLFGIAKGEKTNDELVDLVNAWCAEKYEAGVPLYYYYVMGKPEEFRVAPHPLIQPHGAGNIIQTAGTVDTPITVKCVTHS